MIRAVVLRSASRQAIDDLTVYRPTNAGSISLVLMVALNASDDEIVTAVRGLLSDDELVAVAAHLTGEDGAV